MDQFNPFAKDSSERVAPVKYKGSAKLRDRDVSREKSSFVDSAVTQVNAGRRIGGVTRMTP